LEVVMLRPFALEAIIKRQVDGTMVGVVAQPRSRLS
jgi:hypothetical protein